MNFIKLQNFVKRQFHRLAPGYVARRALRSQLQTDNPEPVHAREIYDRKLLSLGVNSIDVGSLRRRRIAAAAGQQKKR